MEKIVAKFQCSTVTHDEYSESPSFHAVYTGTPEDNTFAKATPSASCSMRIDNTDAHGFFKPGKKYYATFTEAAD